MTKRAAGGCGRDAFWCLLAGLALTGCGEDAKPASSAGRFVPVARAQPTESGPWVVDANDPLTLYALGTRSLRSRDGGHTWAELAWPANARSLSFASRPQPALFLQVEATGDGSDTVLFESLDGGESWKRVGIGARGDVTVVESDSGAVLLSATEHGISSSTDDGATWVDAVLPAHYDALPFTVGRTLVANGAGPTVYAEALGFDDARLEFQALVLVSSDAGATFVAKSVPAGSAVANTVPPRLSLDCHGRLYTLVDHIAYRSEDAGTTWQRLATLEADTQSFEVMTGTASVCSDSVYAFGDRAQGANLWHIDASGSVDSQALPDSGPVADLGADRLLLTSSTTPLRQRSDDGGRSWWTAGVTLESGSLALSPARPGRLFVTSPRGILRSDDAGRTWQGAAKRTRAFISALDASPHDADVLYARSISGDDSPWSFISTDGGASLQDWPLPSPEDPQIPEAIAASGTGRITVVTQRGAYTADDAGQPFTPLKVIPAQQQILSAAIGASDPPSIYMYVYTTDSPANEIVASADGGATWTSVDPGQYVSNLVAHPSDPRIAFGLPGSGGPGFLRTLDGGQTWSQLPSPEADSIHTLHLATTPAHDLYALGQNLYRSQDQGDTWQRLAAAPPHSYEFQLASSPGDTPYVLGSSGLLYVLIE